MFKAGLFYAISPSIHLSQTSVAVFDFSANLLQFSSHIYHMWPTPDILKVFGKDQIASGHCDWHSQTYIPFYQLRLVPRHNWLQLESTQNRIQSLITCDSFDKFAWVIDHLIYVECVEILHENFGQLSLWFAPFIRWWWFRQR